MINPNKAMVAVAAALVICAALALADCRARLRRAEEKAAGARLVGLELAIRQDAQRETLAEIVAELRAQGMEVGRCLSSSSPSFFPPSPGSAGVGRAGRRCRAGGSPWRSAT